VPGKLSTDMVPTVITPPSIQVINPLTMLSEVTYPLDCSAITGGSTADNTSAGVGITGIAIAANQHVLVSACGFPIILTLNPGGTITVLNVITQVGGGDEVWYNPGDDRFYVTGALNGVTGNEQQLGVIDAKDSSFLQNVSEFGLRGKNPAAFSGTNSIFTIQSINIAIVNGTIPDDSLCATFNIINTGCIAVFTH
jgi:hypothetical protein